MKRKILLSPLIIVILIIVFGAGVVGAAVYFGGAGEPGDVSLQKGLIGWWKFDGNAKDNTPNSNNGTVTGAVLTTDRKAQANKAYSLNGTSDHISIGNVGTVSTVSFWMLADDTTTRKIINMDGTKQIELDGSSNVVATSFPAATVYVNGSSASANIPDTTNWYFVTVTDTTGVSASTFDIGAVSTSYFSGKLDDVRIYSRALSATEITALYQSYDPSFVVSDLQKGLIGQWKFDGNAKDNTPNSNNGTLNGNAAATGADRKGQVNKAATFDGSGDYVTIPDNAAWNFMNGDFTMSMWVKWNTLGTQMGLWEQTNGGTQDIFFYKQATDKIRMHAYISGYLAAYTTDTTITSGVWYHIVFQRSGNTGYIYFNGVSQALTVGTAFSAAIADISPNIEIGGSHTDSDRWWLNGFIDDLRIYNRALSQTEITALYQSYDPSVQISDLQKGLIGQWKMDGNAKDNTPYSNNGTLTGTTLTTDRRGTANKAYSFNGTTNYVSMGNVLNFTYNSPLTIGAWIKTSYSSLADFATVVSKQSNSSPYNGYTFNVYGDGTIRLDFIGSTGRLLVSQTLGTAVNDNNWHYIVVTKTDQTGANVKLYVDGIAQSTNITINTLTAGGDVATALEIGARDGANQPFIGSIDDVRIYNRALSAAEVLALYESY